MAITSARFQNIDRYVSAYINEKHTYAKYWFNTAVVSRSDMINVNMEDFYGTIRYIAPLGNTLQYDGANDTDGTRTVINIATQTTDEASSTNLSTYTEQVIKQYHAIRGDSYDYGETITRGRGLKDLANMFGEARNRDMDNVFVSVLNGISDLESSRGSAGRESPDTVAEASGFYVDLHKPAVQAFYSGTAGKLIDEAGTSISDKISPLIACLSLGWSDYEMGTYYLLTSPRQLLKLKQANVIDYKTVVENGIEFMAILDGKIRILPSRTSLASQATKANVTATSTSTSFIIRANSFALGPAPVMNPIAFERDESRGRGSGITEYYYRYSYVIHPKGYSWTGTLTAQPTPTTLSARANWTRRAQMLNLGALPIYHVA